MPDISSVRTLKEADLALAGISLWDLCPEDLKHLYAIINRALQSVRTGRELEIVVCGDYSAQALYLLEEWIPERPFDECLREVLEQERITSGGWDPRNPPCLFQRLLQYEIQRTLCEQLQDGKPPRDCDVRIYPSVGTDLDFFHGADCVVIIEDIVVTYDVTTDDGNDKTRADLLVHLHKTLKCPEEFREEGGERRRIPHGIEFLAAWIVAKYFEKAIPNAS